EPAGTLERPVDQLRGAVAREDEDDALLDGDAIEGAEEDRLVLGLAHGLAVAQGQVHVVEEDDAAALDAEEVGDAVGGAGLAVRVRSDQAPFPATAAALLPDPATGHGLAVARRPHEQHAASGPAAVLLDAAQVARLQVANGIPPQDLGL